jgi:N-acetyl-anhydromuramyl-L-alanine amidase AmpD
MKRKRNFSFNRFESEQLNELHKLVEQIKDNYSLVLDQNVIGLDYLPLTAANAQSLLAKED